MYYRQKILLSLIEIFGGQLQSTDFQKLLFLYCQLTKTNHYDFFPYKFGAFSFTSAYDKQKLIATDLLKDSNDFSTAGTKSFISQLTPEDRIKLKAFYSKFRHLRGQELVKQTYLDYPLYAIRSEIVTAVLNKDEFRMVSSNWNGDFSTKLFTIGYESSTIDQYLYRLITNNVSVLVDVRKNPYSHKHGFTQKSLKNYAEKTGINYFHMPELGIASHLRKELEGPDDYAVLFDYYAKDILPSQDATLSKLRQLIITHRRVAITCFEADPLMCHRHKISERIEADRDLDISVSHL
jgi:hypothetical protein